MNKRKGHPMTEKELVAAAWKARQGSASHFSHYPVGAALETEGGDLYLGANVESSSYGLSCCAERVALFKAITEGHRKFTRIAVAATGKINPSPCGACRQLLMDYAPNAQVLLSGSEDKWDVTSVSELLPRPFTAEHF